MRVTPNFIFNTCTILLISGVSMAQASRIIISSSANESTHGLYVYECDKTTGSLDLLGKTDAVKQSSYHNIHPNKNFLYSVGNNEVRAFKIPASGGELTLINKQSSMSNGPCYVSVDHTGKYVFVANYGGGGIASYGIKADGGLTEAISVIQHEGSSVNKERQEKAHPHLIMTSPDNNYVLVPDLGMDQIVIYSLDHESGTLSKHSSASALPGSGPRHMEFHPSGKYVYVLNELLSTVGVYKWNAKTGKMSQIETAELLPKDFEDFNKSADIHLTSDGNYLYASNRGHNSLTAFKVKKNGKLELINQYTCEGDWPRNFFILPDNQHLYVANRQSNEVVLFSIDLITGALSMKERYKDIPGALCIKLVD